MSSILFIIMNSSHAESLEKVHSTVCLSSCERDQNFNEIEKIRTIFSRWLFFFTKEIVWRHCQRNGNSLMNRTRFNCTRHNDKNFEFFVLLCDEKFLGASAFGIRATAYSIRVEQKVKKKKRFLFLFFSFFFFFHWRLFEYFLDIFVVVVVSHRIVHRMTQQRERSHKYLREKNTTRIQQRNITVNVRMLGNESAYHHLHSIYTHAEASKCFGAIDFWANNILFNNVITITSTTRLDPK